MPEKIKIEKMTNSLKFRLMDTTHRITKWQWYKLQPKRSYMDNPNYTYKVGAVPTKSWLF